VVCVIVDYHDLAPIIELYLVARGAAAGWWVWCISAVTLVTAGPRAPS
jgi:hypothetical protein